MFFLRSHVQNGDEINPGDKVTFIVGQGRNGNEARNVTITQTAMGAPVALSNQTFTGTVKSFNQEKGWGFIVSPEAKAKFGKDMFLHKDNFSQPEWMPQPGDQVHFQ